MSSALDALLAETITRHVSADTRVLHRRSRPIETARAEREVFRHEVTYRVGDTHQETVRLITKRASFVERRTWQLLNRQNQAHVPFSHALDYADPEPTLICLQDVGDTTRPTSLDPITEHEVVREATGLASIHRVNLGKGAELGWLPRIDRAYVAWSIGQMWRPAWTRVRADPAFNRTFANDIPAIEAAADTIVDDVG